MGIERREHPRILVRAMVDYESQDTFLYDYSQNLSEGGLFINTESPLAVGEVLDLKFSLPDIEKVFQVKGEVKWVIEEKKGPLMKGMGIAFKDLSDDDRKLIQSYMEKLDSE